MKRWDKWGRIVGVKAHDTCLGVGVMVLYAIILHFLHGWFWTHIYVQLWKKFHRLVVILRSAGFIKFANKVRY